MADRHFTKTQVEAFIREIHPQGRGDVLEFKHIAVLRGAPVAAWKVQYDVVHPWSTGGESRTPLVDIIIERTFLQETFLYPLVDRDIPDGCATVEEEDFAIKEAEKASRARLGLQNRE